MAQLKFSNILWDGMGAGATVAWGIVIFLKVPQYQQWAVAASCYHMGWPLGFSHRCKAVLSLGWFQFKSSCFQTRLHSPVVASDSFMVVLVGESHCETGRLVKLISGLLKETIINVHSKLLSRSEFKGDSLSVTVSDWLQIRFWWHVT